MKFVIPAKTSSTRVPNKNYREFARGLSLLEILVHKLIDVADAPSDIYISCENDSKRDVIEGMGASFLPRPEHLAENSYPYQSVVAELCSAVPGTDDVMYCHCTDPFFDEHARVIKQWQERDRTNTDSVTVVYPMREYLLDPDFRPIGFGFGAWHVPSQQLPTHYLLGFTCSIATRDAITRHGAVSAQPSWYIAANQTIDIDTLEEFELAATLYTNAQSV